MNAAAAAAAAAAGMNGIGGAYGDLTNSANAAAAGMLASQLNGNPHLGFTNIVNGMNPLMHQQQNMGVILDETVKETMEVGIGEVPEVDETTEENSAWGNDGGGGGPRGNPLTNNAELATLNSAVPRCKRITDGGRTRGDGSRFGSIEECVGQISILARDQYGLPHSPSVSLTRTVLPLSTRASTKLSKKLLT